MKNIENRLDRIEKTAQVDEPRVLVWIRGHGERPTPEKTAKYDHVLMMDFGTPQKP